MIATSLFEFSAEIAVEQTFCVIYFDLLFFFVCYYDDSDNILALISINFLKT